MHLNSCSMDLGRDSVSIKASFWSWVLAQRMHGGPITHRSQDRNLALIPYVTTQGKALATSALYLKRTSHNLRLLVAVNKAQIHLVNNRCRTHHTPTHITQSIKLGHHKEHLWSIRVICITTRVYHTKCTITHTRANAHAHEHTHTHTYIYTYIMHNAITRSGKVKQTLPTFQEYGPIRYRKCKTDICHTLGMRPTTGYKDDNPNTSF